MDSQKIKQLILQKSKELGFFYCGFSKAEFLDEEAPRLEKWLNLNYQGKMGYMGNNFDKRLDPRLLVDNANEIGSPVLSIIFSRNSDASL